VQDKNRDLFDLDPLANTVPIGSLVNDDGQVSVTRIYAFSPEGFTHELRLDWNSWRGSLCLIAFWNSRHKYYSSLSLLDRASSW